ncbi:hypothetical protein GOB94_09220 [Granulicella sp. 5B5]|nr:hypothetical protein GOB94_09220 [Granulicella sp. 5B5]
MPPLVRRVRAYFAPVNRVAHQPTIFDPAQMGLFAFSAPPAPWIDLGWITKFARHSGTKVLPVRMGAPATTYLQARTEVEATVGLNFESWGKLQLSLSCGTQQLNLLHPAAGATAEGSGAAAVSAVAIESGSTASVLQVGTAAAAAFTVGQWVAVDVDCSGQTGYLGSGVSGAYVRTALTDVDYVRRITLNVSQITAIANGALTLRTALLAGVPTSAMKASPVVGFCDREGSSFFQEWSALFVGEGQQGERVLWHYPRLQALSGAAETNVASSGGYEKVALGAAFRALPVKDPVDGETVVCFRSYVIA